MEVLKETGNTEKVTVYIGAPNITEPTGRSVFPVVPEITQFELWGGISGAEEIPIKSFTTLTDASVELEVGTWNFTLKAYQDEALVLEGKKQNITISLAVSTLEFELMSLSSGKGSIEITIELPSNSGVYSVVTTIQDEVVEPALQVVDNKIVYNQHDVDANNDYFIYFTLKDSHGNTVAVVSEIVVVQMNLVSRKTITLTADDLNAAPTAPGNLHATILEKTETTISLRFEWEDRSNNETGFVLNDEQTDYPIDAALTVYDLGSISLNVPAYRIKAVNDFGSSAWTEIIPLIPTELSAIATSSSSINISWMALWANKYRIYRSLSPADSFEVIKEEHNTMAYPDTSLTDATVYYYKILAINTAGESELSSPISAITLLSTPQSPVVDRQLVTGVTLSWQQVSGATSYKVYYNTTNSFNTATQFSPLQPITNTQCTVTGLIAKNVYYLWLTAHNDKTYSEPSLSTTSGTIDSSITTDFKNPSDPVLLLNGGAIPDNIRIRQIQHDSYVISVESDGWLINKWLLDGIAVSTGNSYTIDWQIPVGPHVITVIATKNGIPYSAFINFTVVNR
jgi:hypothetical protein